MKPILKTHFLPGWLSVALAFVAAGTALSSKTLIGIKRSVENAGASGFLSVGRGVAEANQAFLICVYLAGFSLLLAALFKWRKSNRSALAQSWFSAVSSALTLGLVLGLWIAESILIRSMSFTREGVIPDGGLIAWLLLVVLVGSSSLAVLFLIVSIVRVFIPTRSTWSSSIVVFVVASLIVAVCGFQLRNAWINTLYKTAAEQALGADSPPLTRLALPALLPRLSASLAAPFPPPAIKTKKGYACSHLTRAKLALLCGTDVTDVTLRKSGS